MRSWTSLVAVSICFVLLAAVAVYGVLNLDGEAEETFLVVRVMDGDTIKLENGEVVRYLLIDTPETTEEPVDCYGPEATDRNRELVEGRRVTLERDESDRDAYGRLLRYVYVDGTLVQGLLVREGFGYVYSRQPDVRYLKDMAALEREARADSAGLWSAC